jgi:hypothetical protein
MAARSERRAASMSADKADLLRRFCMSMAAEASARCRIAASQVHGQEAVTNTPN